jgi:hypothetical protein
MENAVRSIREFTTVDGSGYPLYRRRNNGRTVEIKGKIYSNQDVVPYNKYLLLKYGCHINVEVVAQVISSSKS